MSIISLASGSSCWRGLDYYKNDQVKNLKKINCSEWTSEVIGSKTYNVYLDIDHPRKSTCDCPLAKGKKIICKHIVATYFKAIPNSAKEFEDEQNKLQEEYEEYENKEYQSVIEYINKLSKKDLIEELIGIFDYAPEWVYDNFIKRNNIKVK